MNDSINFFSVSHRVARCVTGKRLKAQQPPVLKGEHQ